MCQELHCVSHMGKLLYCPLTALDTDSHLYFRNTFPSGFPWYRMYLWSSALFQIIFRCWLTSVQPRKVWPFDFLLAFWLSSLNQEALKYQVEASDSGIFIITISDLSLFLISSPVCSEVSLTAHSGYLVSISHLTSPERMLHFFLNLIFSLSFLFHKMEDLF